MKTKSKKEKKPEDAVVMVGIMKVGNPHLWELVNVCLKALVEIDRLYPANLGNRAGLIAEDAIKLIHEVEENHLVKFMMANGVPESLARLAAKHSIKKPLGS